MVRYEIIDLRKFGVGTHKSVDDRPFGGGPGMILRADVLAEALKSVKQKAGSRKREAVILMSASGKTYNQEKAWELTKFDHLIIICGHYEGVDQRFIENYVTEEISIGDYVLTGGEIPSLVVLDSVVRLLPGVLKKEGAATEESFSPSIKGYLEYPQYTRPETFEGTSVPKILTSGNHEKIKKWREDESVKKTATVRPDLLKS